MILKSKINLKMKLTTILNIYKQVIFIMTTNGR